MSRNSSINGNKHHYQRHEKHAGLFETLSETARRRLKDMTDTKSWRQREWITRDENWRILNGYDLKEKAESLHEAFERRIAVLKAELDCRE